MFQSSNYFFGYAFDALLTLTTAFERLKTCPNQFQFDSVWRQTCWRDELLNIIHNIDIEGVTGRIRFHRGDRIGEIVIEQILGKIKEIIERFSFHFHFDEFCYLVVQNRRSTQVQVVELFVASPVNHSRYHLLHSRNGRNITWHGNIVI